MLGGARELQQTLTDYERVYYNNYEYYNQVEEMKNYRNDLSKMRFNVCRNSITSIVLQDTLSSNYSDDPEH